MANPGRAGIVYLSRCGSLFRQSSPAGIARAYCTVARRPFAHELDINVVLIRGQMPPEVVEKVRPIGLQPVDLEMAQWKNEPVINAD